MKIQVTYHAKWQIKDATWHKWTTCKKLINCRTGREIKKVYQKGSIGYCIEGRFYSLKFLRGYLRKIKIIDCPF